MFSTGGTVHVWIFSEATHSTFLPTCTWKNSIPITTSRAWVQILLTLKQLKITCLWIFIGYITVSNSAVYTNFTAINKCTNLTQHRNKIKCQEKEKFITFVSKWNLQHTCALPRIIVGHPSLTKKCSDHA